MLRGQAELISTVIIVAIAVVLALGVVYYLVPLVTQARLSQLLHSTLAEASAGIGGGVVAVANGTELNVSFTIVNLAAGNAYTLYASVIVFDNTSGLPVASVNSSFYLMNGSRASLSSDDGWVELPSFTVSGSYVNVFIRDGYYPVSSVSNVTVVNMATLGLFEVGDSRVYKVVISDPAVCEEGVCTIVVFIMVNNAFYAVQVIPVIVG